MTFLTFVRDTYLDESTSKISCFDSFTKSLIVDFQYFRSRLSFTSANTLIPFRKRKMTSI